MHYSASFWVAVSFLLFICSSWYFVRNAFLNTMNQYRNSISSTLGNLMAQRQESHKILEKSVEKLHESHSNIYVLNAHKVAKNIADSSEAKLALLKNHMHVDAQSAIKAFQHFIERKMYAEILDLSSKVVEQYIVSHNSQFNNIAISETIRSFSK